MGYKQPLNNPNATPVLGLMPQPSCAINNSITTHLYMLYYVCDSSKIHSKECVLPLGGNTHTKLPQYTT